MLHQAIAKQAAWQAKPEVIESRPNSFVRKGKPGTRLMMRIYAGHTEDWTAFALAEPRCMNELREKMFELSGHKPTEGAVYTWAKDHGITIRIDRAKLGLSKIANEMWEMRKSGHKIAAIVRFARSRGFDVSPIQINSAIGHAKRGRR